MLTMRPRSQAPARLQGVARPYAPPALAEVAAALEHVNPDNRDTWVRMALAMRAEFGDDDNAHEVWDRWSRGSARYVERDARDVWRSAKARSVTIATLFHEARANGYRPVGRGSSSAAKPTGTRRPPELPKQKAWDAELQRAWDECMPLAGTLGERYLAGRRCAIPPDDGDVRFHPAAWHPFDKCRLPALVSRVTDPVSAAPMTLHTSFLQEQDGSVTKADIDPQRLLRGGYAAAGGVIRLWPDDYVETCLTVAEGIETALTAAHARPPAWACISAGNLAGLPVLAGVESLLIVADHDCAGLGAARACGNRWSDAGREVLLYKPQNDGADLNDEVAHG